MPSIFDASASVPGSSTPPVDFDVTIDRALNAELVNIAGRVAPLLGCKITDLQAFEPDVFPFGHNSTAFRDKPIKQVSVLPGSHYITITRRNAASTVLGIGITIYQCREAPALRYAQVTYRPVGSQNIFMVFFTKRKEVFSVWRHNLSQAKLDRPVLRKPILDGSFIADVVDATLGFLRSKDQMKKYNIKMTRGLIFDGSPGNGKTMLCRYIEGLAELENFSVQTITSSSIESAYSHDSLDGLFAAADVLFFDDIDIAYLDRKSGNGKMACAILTAMDGMQQGDEPVVRIFTTNESIDSLDEAFTRPGRIDKQFRFNKPTTELKRQLIATWHPDILAHFEPEPALEQMEDFSFADVEAVKSDMVLYYMNRGEWSWKRALKSVIRSKEAVGGKRRKTAGFNG